MSHILRLPEVIKETGLSRSTIYNLIKEGSFPPPIKLSSRASGWLSDEIEHWKASRITRSHWRAE